MSNWPRSRDTNRIETLNINTGGSGLPFIVTSGGSANVKGSWLQVTASTSFAYDGMTLLHRHSTARKHALDIAIGASGSEQIIVSDFLLYSSTSSAASRVFDLPIAIKGGSRVAIRIASDAASGQLTVAFYAYARGWDQPRGFSGATQVGFSGTTGTTVDPGGTINTKGSWAAIGGATARPYSCIILCIEGLNFPTAPVSAEYLIDIAIDASFTIVINNLHYIQGGVTSGGGPTIFGPLYLNLKSGTQVYARCRSSTNTVGSRELQISYLGFYR